METLKHTEEKRYQQIIQNWMKTEYFKGLMLSSNWVLAPCQAPYPHFLFAVLEKEKVIGSIFGSIAFSEVEENIVYCICRNLSETNEVFIYRLLTLSPTLSICDVIKTSRDDKPFRQVEKMEMVHQQMKWTVLQPQEWVGSENYSRELSLFNEVKFQFWLMEQGIREGTFDDATHTTFDPSCDPLYFKTEQTIDERVKVNWNPMTPGQEEALAGILQDEKARSK